LRGKTILIQPKRIATSRPGAGRPTREQAQQRMAELLDAALDMFLDRGFELTTIEAIAQSLGMTKRTVYARYADKAALFRAAVRQAIEQWVIGEDCLLDLGSRELPDALTEIARIRVKHLVSPQGIRLQRILAAESYRFPELASLTNDQGSQPLIDFLAGLLSRHAAEGSIRLDRPALAATVFFSMVVGGQVRIAVHGMAPDMKVVEDRIAFSVDLFLTGLHYRPQCGASAA